MRISDERLAELIALYAKEQEDAKPWVGEASVEADVHAALMELATLRRPAHDDDVLSVIVKDLRELQQPWAAVDVDDRNALAAKWRALMRRPVVQSDEVETIRALLAKHYYPSEPGKAYRTLLSALDAAQREIQQLNSKCSQLEINIGSAISENQNTASRFHQETSLLMEARKRIAELQRVPEERKEIAERQETRHKYSMSGWTFFQNCSHRSAIEDIDALLQDAARYRNAHDVLMAERNGMASRIQQLQSDFEFLERAKQLISDEGAQRSRDLATVMHERNGMVGRIERLEGACKRTLEWAKGRMPCKDGECCAELRSEIEALSVALAAADGQQHHEYCDTNELNAEGIVKPCNCATGDGAAGE